MKNLAVFFVLILIASCARISECNYSLIENGWILTSDPPKELIDQYNSNSKWFTNSVGDYIACPKLIGEYHCVNVYQKFIKQSNGVFEEKMSVCLI